MSSVVEYFLLVFDKIFGTKKKEYCVPIFKISKIEAMNLKKVEARITAYFANTLSSLLADDIQQCFVLWYFRASDKPTFDIFLGRDGGIFELSHLDWILNDSDSDKLMYKKITDNFLPLAQSSIARLVQDAAQKTRHCTIAFAEFQFNLETQNYACHFVPNTDPFAQFPQALLTTNWRVSMLNELNNDKLTNTFPYKWYPSDNEYLTISSVPKAQQSMISISS